MASYVARSGKRIPLQIAVQLIDPYSDVVEQSTTQDVSSTGVSVTASHSMDYGRRWVLHLPGRRARAIVKVIYCRALDNGSYLIGLQARQPPLRWLDEPPPE